MQESGFFARDEPILGLGPAPEVASRAFDMKQGEVAGPLRASRGFVFETLVAKQDPYIPKLEEVKDRVRDEVVKQKSARSQPAEGGRARGEAEGGARFREGRESRQASKPRRPS